MICGSSRFSHGGVGLELRHRRRKAPAAQVIQDQTFVSFICLQTNLCVEVRLAGSDLVGSVWDLFGQYGFACYFFSLHLGTTWSSSSCLLCCSVVYEFWCALCILWCGVRGLVSHGCMSSSDAFSLSAGDFLSMQPIRHLASDESQSGRLNAPRRILANSAAGRVSWKGYRPMSMVYRDTPTLQMSAARPE